MNLKNTMIAAISALALGAATLPTEAAPHFHGGGGGFHGGGGFRGGGFRGGYHGGGGYGVGLGVLGLGLAAGALAGGAYYGGPYYGYGYGYDGCYRYRPIYDYYGNYVGRRLVNVCY